MAYPTNPTSGDTYTLGSKTWTYNGTNWVNQATFASGSSASVAFSDLTSTPTTLAGYGITDGGSGGGGSGGAGGIKSVQVFTSSGTWTRPSNITKVMVYVTGGGGGGGLYATGLDASTSIKLIDVSGISTATITVGTGGAGAAYGTTGSAGGSSSWSDGTNTVTNTSGGDLNLSNGRFDAGSSASAIKTTGGFWGGTYGQGGTRGSDPDEGANIPGGTGTDGVVYVVEHQTISGSSGGGGSVDPNQVVFPDWASPNSTYLTSGTWSKGSLADTDYVWIYMVGGGSGGGKGGSGYVQGGDGGTALLMYGQAQYFDGGTYAVGAGNGVGSATGTNVAAGDSTFTLSSANGSAYYTTKYYTPARDLFSLVESKKITNTATQISTQLSAHSVFIFPTDGAGNLTYPAIPSEATGSETVWGNDRIAGGLHTPARNSVFGGGGGGGAYASVSKAQGRSLYAGAGAAYNSGNDGAVPGGGGAGGDAADGSQSGSGGNGSIRVYHV